MTDKIERAILNIGKTCLFKSGKGIEAQITAVKCSDTHFTYECAWFNEGGYHVAEFEEYEIEVMDE